MLVLDVETKGQTTCNIDAIFGPSTLFLPRQVATLGSAASTMPAPHLLRLAVPMESFPALAAACPPFSFGHLRLAAAQWLGSNLQAFLFPDPIMAVTMTDQGMSDFMQDGVHDLFGRIL